MKPPSTTAYFTHAACFVVILPIIAVAGCGGGEPFAMTPCSGKILYEDGTLLPAEGNSIRLTFIPQTPPVDPKTWPRPGIAEVTIATGCFDIISSHKYGDGLIAGKHKVIITRSDRQGVPIGVPPEYGDVSTTPLEVDTAQQPFVLKVRKPSPPSS